VLRRLVIALDLGISDGPRRVRVGIGGCEVQRLQTRASPVPQIGGSAGTLEAGPLDRVRRPVRGEIERVRLRLTLGEVRQQILAQSDVFGPSDVIPVPCHPDCLAMAYAMKIDGKAIPLSGLIDPKVLLHGEGSTIVYEKSDAMRGELFKLFSTAASPQSSEKNLAQLLCCLPQVCVPGGFGYENIFRVIIMKFMDAYDMDVRSVKKTCVHIAHPDGKRIIPFDTYNLFYRDDRVQLLEQIRGTAARLAILS